MGTMTDEIRERITTNLTEARTARRLGNWDHCWQLLKDAHVLSQPWVWPHVRVHRHMLVAGWEAHDVREVVGQFLRLVVGGPASALGRYPTGNSGRARVRATKPMSIRPDLAEILERSTQRPT
jgi:hypothetical protein